MIKIQDPFILHVQTEMNWNGAKLEEVNRHNENSVKTVEWHSDLSRDEWTRAFYYQCLPGSSVKREITSCVREYFEDINGNDIKIKVVPDSTTNRSRNNQHYYFIIFLK